LPEPSLAGLMRRLRASPVVLRELQELPELRRETLTLVPRPVGLPVECPLSLHASYTRGELLAALGHWNLDAQPGMREGVLYPRELPADLFLVALNKAEGEYSRTTMCEGHTVTGLSGCLRSFSWLADGRGRIARGSGGSYLPRVEPAAGRRNPWNLGPRVPRAP